jgi:hypothetical protein
VTPEERHQLLSHVKLGHSVAEEEAESIKGYFVKTDQWKRLDAGEIDVVLGAKGSGKSALYTLLSQSESTFFDRNILIYLAENPQGSPVFEALVGGPTLSERSFSYLWKLYFLTLIGNLLRDYGIASQDATELVKALEEAKLLPKQKKAGLQAIFESVRGWLSSFLTEKLSALEFEVTINPDNGMPLAKIKSAWESESEPEKLARLPIEQLLGVANSALESADLNAWILLDRLDVAFHESGELERVALRSLFRTYLDLKAYKRLCLKLFVRHDVWHRLTQGGFTELSHITKTSDIAWGTEGLVNLIVQRLLKNEFLIKTLDINSNEVLSSYQEQEKLLLRILPDDLERRLKGRAIDWMVRRLADGSGHTAPRELIQLWSYARERQMRRIERGEAKLDGDKLFESNVFEAALSDVSTTRFTKTLLAEYKFLEIYVKAFEGQKTEYSVSGLCRLWNVDPSEAARLATHLVEVGFFEKPQGRTDGFDFIVAWIYRPTLNLVNGKAFALTTNTTSGPLTFGKDTGTNSPSGK